MKVHFFRVGTSDYTEEGHWVYNVTLELSMTDEEYIVMMKALNDGKMRIGVDE